jgi:hypothetical protein
METKETIVANKIDDYIAGLTGWQAEVAAALRKEVLAVGGITETFKWGQPVFESEYGPVCLIKANKANIGFGFWRGQQMAELDARFAPVGNFKMADIKLKGPGEIGSAEVRRLVDAGIRLNQQHGDPLKDLKG